MSKPIQRFFTFGSDGILHDATVSETSEALESCANYTWSVAPNPIGVTGGNPKYTIEVSNNGTIWYEYNSLSTNVDIVDAVDDIHLAFTMMRIVYNGTGVSAGTIEFLFTQKAKS